MTESVVWGIHAPEALGDLFLRKNIIAIGWSLMKDLSKIAPNREAYKEAFRQAYPDDKPGAIPINAGTLFKFANEIKVKDYVIYPSKYNRKVNIGRIKDEYRHAPKIDDEYLNVRDVEWLKSFPRSDFSQGALYEIGSFITLFQVRNFADEFLSMLEGELQTVPVEEDESVGLVVADIEGNTQDFILKTLSQKLKGHPFADFVAHILNCMGYRTRVSPEGPDGGIDIMAHRDELGFEPPIIKVQCKSSEGTVGDPEVSALYGKVEPNEFGLLVTLGTFSNQAKTFARNKSNLRLIDGGELISLIFQHYNKFDAQYKALLPLKRVYVPGA